MPHDQQKALRIAFHLYEVFGEEAHDVSTAKIDAIHNSVAFDTAEKSAFMQQWSRVHSILARPKLKNYILRSTD